MHAMDQPLVTVICTVYNQFAYVERSLRSVFEQTYARLELLVIDNGSTDGSLGVVQRVIKDFPNAAVIANPENKGLCKAFNQGLRLARGRYIIDLSADDVLYPHRIARQVAVFERLPLHYAVVFSNAKRIDAAGKSLGYHFRLRADGRAADAVPAGDVFKEVLERYFICTPTMMIRKTVLDEMGGYDESLFFEDFDFWVRSARNYAYYYQDEVLTAKRLHRDAMSLQVMEKNNVFLHSLWIVCRKARELCRNGEECRALGRRIQTFIRKCWYAEQYELAFQFYDLLTQLKTPDYGTGLLVQLCRFRIPVNDWYQCFQGRNGKTGVSTLSRWSEKE